MAGRPWHEQEPEEYAQIRAQLDQEFPYLYVSVRDGLTLLTGDLPLIAEGKVIDQFEIEVIIPRGGPRSDIPIVREIGGRIPRDAEHHMQVETGDACLCVRDEFWFKNPHGMQLVEFLRGPVSSYFVGQLSYSLGNGWPYGHRGHGADGIIEFYAPVVGTSDRATICRYLEIIAAKKLRAHWRCPCGSGQRISDCHGDLMQRLRARIPRGAASYSLGILTDRRPAPRT